MWGNLIKKCTQSHRVCWGKSENQSGKIPHGTGSENIERETKERNTVWEIFVFSNSQGLRTQMCLGMSEKFYQ